MSVEILPPGLPLNESLPSGRQRLTRDFKIEIDGELFWCPEGFEHDGSSWPRCLPGPRFSRILCAGICHDYAFRYATHGQGGRELSYVEANRIWYRVSLAGEHHDAKANKFWAWCGRIGLFCGGILTWRRYRKADAA